MKLARFASLLLIPMAFGAVVVPQEEVNEQATVAVEVADIPTENLMPEALKRHIALANFLEKARIETNKAIQAETNRLQMEDGPTNLTELLNMIFSTEAINMAQTHAAATNNPFQDLINGVANVVNGVVGGATNGVQGLINGVGDLAGGIQDAFNGLTGGLKPPTNSTTAKTTPAQTNNTSPLDGLFQGLAFVTNDTGNLLNEITGGILNADVLNKGFDIVSDTVDDFVSGKISFGDALNRVYEFFVKLYGAENPLGKFIQNLATYLSNNQDGIFANLIKFGTFINAVLITLSALIINSVNNIAGGVFGAIGNILKGIFGGLFQRLQEQNIGDITVYENAVYDAIFSQAATVALDKTSYAQQILDIINAAVKKILAADPFIYTILSNPSDANIKKAVDAVTMVFTAPRP